MDKVTCKAMSRLIAPCKLEFLRANAIIPSSEPKTRKEPASRFDPSYSWSGSPQELLSTGNSSISASEDSAKEELDSDEEEVLDLVKKLLTLQVRVSPSIRKKASSCSHLM